MQRCLVWTFSFFLFGCADPEYFQDNRFLQDITETVMFDCNYQFPKSKICMNFQWKTMPSEKDPGAINFRLFTIDALDGRPSLIEKEGNLRVILWMPAMGHGSSAPILVTQSKPGTYIASPMYFAMPGEWEIKFQLIREGYVTDEIVLPFAL